MRLLTGGALLLAACQFSSLATTTPAFGQAQHVGRDVARTACRLETQFDGSDYIFLCGKDGVSLGRAQRVTMHFSPSLGRYLVIFDTGKSKSILIAWPRASGSPPVIEDMGQDVAIAAFGEGADPDFGKMTIDSSVFESSDTIALNDGSGPVTVAFVADGILTRIQRR